MNSSFGCLCVVHNYTRLSIRAICATLPTRSQAPHGMRCHAPGGRSADGSTTAHYWQVKFADAVVPGAIWHRFLGYGLTLALRSRVRQLGDAVALGQGEVGHTS